ncbi:hypothetical protein BJ912DRAFT_1056983 [Pholiota molesta]|nr:hypothetical protein BJ912DRAFT_1056983 [Pholiota molesta]
MNDSEYCARLRPAATIPRLSIARTTINGSTRITADPSHDNALRLLPPSIVLRSFGDHSSIARIQRSITSCCPVRRSTANESGHSVRRRSAATLDPTCIAHMTIHSAPTMTTPLEKHGMLHESRAYDEQQQIRRTTTPCCHRTTINGVCRMTVDTAHDDALPPPSILHASPI